MQVSKIAHLLLIAGVAVYLLSSIIPWHTLDFTSYNDSLHVSESMTPFGTWFNYEDNSTYASFLMVNSNFSSNNTTLGNMPPVGNRLTIFSFIRYFYLVNFAVFVAVGVIMALGAKKIAYILSFLAAMIIVGSILIFLLMYQDALTADMQMTGISNLDMYGGKVFTLNGVLSSGLDWGFGTAMTSTILILLASFIYVSAPVESKEKEKVEKKSAEEKPKEVKKKEKKEEEGHIKKVTIKCPNCGNEFKVDVDMSKLPVTVQCPYCGTKGKIG